MSLTRREAAIISAYTGVMLGSFADLHEYAEAILGRRIWTHEYARLEFTDGLKNAARPDFVALKVSA